MYVKVKGCNPFYLKHQGEYSNIQVLVTVSVGSKLEEGSQIMSTCTGICSPKIFATLLNEWYDYGKNQPLL